jgi:hypothetical protein
MQSQKVDKTTFGINGNCTSVAALQEYAESALTLGDIAPTWYRILGQRLQAYSLKRLLWYLHMASPETCIVGEAYGFSSSYMRDCADCVMFSRVFLHNFPAGSYGALYETIRQFIAHWNHHHKNITSRISNSRPRRRLRWYDAFLRFDDHVLTYHYR